MVLEDDPPDKDLLAKADTAPRMFLFVPIELAIIFFILFFAINTQFHSLVKGFLVVPFWIGAAILVGRDVNGVRCFMVRCRVATTMLDRYRWGGDSVTPWPTKGKRGDRRAI